MQNRVEVAYLLWSVAQSAFVVVYAAARRLVK